MKKPIRLLYKDRKELYKLQNQLRSELWVDNLDNAFDTVIKIIKVFQRSKKYTEKDFHVNSFNKTFKQ